MAPTRVTDTVTEDQRPGPPPAEGSRGLAIRLSMAMFVLVVDTSLMNVSIAVVVRDLGTTVSGVQSAIALEALVSAAFILIGSKIGDLYALVGQVGVKKGASVRCRTWAPPTQPAAGPAPPTW